MSARLRRFGAIAASAGIALLPITAMPAAASTSGTTAWVSTFWDENSESNPLNSVQLVDLETGTILDRIELPESRPAELAYSDETGMLWVLSQPWNYENSSIAFVDTGSGDVEQLFVTPTDTFAGAEHDDQYTMVDDWIGDIVASPDGQLIFVTGYDNYSDAGAVLVFDAVTGEYEGAVPLEGYRPEGMAVSSTHNELYVLTVEEDTNNDSDVERVEVIDINATSWAAAAVDVSPGLEWPSVGDENCGGQTALDYDSNSDTVFAVCWGEEGFATWNRATDGVSSTAIEIDGGPSTIGIDVSDDGTHIALGTCYDSSIWAELNSDLTVSNVTFNEDYPGDTSKPVRFFGDGSRYAAGSWDGSLYSFDSADPNPTVHQLSMGETDPDTVNYMYIGSIELAEPYEPAALADTGFDIRIASAVGLLLVIGGVASVAARRRLV